MMPLPPEKWEKVKDLLGAALELKPKETPAFLDEACPEGDVRRELDRLLAYRGQVDNFLSPPVFQQVTTHIVPQRLQSGAILNNRFLIVRFIARGGMGEVYEAEDQELREKVAIKTIRQDLMNQPRFLQTFRREVHLAKQVTHPNVCRIYDFFRHTDADGEGVFVSMEFLSGETLAERIKRAGRMTIQEALPIILQMAEALNAAHAAGILHRDFKPGNVILVSSSKMQGIRAVVTDFGLAFDPSDSGTGATIDSSRGMVGTPAYMAPEQIEGCEFTAASDIYALGLVAYEMLTGRTPFDDLTPFLAVANRLYEAPIPPQEFTPNLDPSLGAMILQCLQREPSARPPVAEIIDAVGLKSLGPQSVREGVRQAQIQRSPGIIDRATKYSGSYLRAILGACLILFITPFVYGLFLLLGKGLFRSNSGILGMVGTGLFDVAAFYFLLRSEKKRKAAEQARNRLKNWVQTSTTAAFRSLAPYSEADVLPGTERKRQARRLVTTIKDPNFRFGVVSGEVGCGKTSLLQSEVQRLLKRDNITAILMSRAQFGDAKDISNLCNTISSATKQGRGPRARILIVDQIEEILIRFPSREARQKIGTLFGEIMRAESPCKIVCAIRKDYFLDLCDLGAAMGIDVHPTLMLRNFTPEEAKEVIQECSAEEGLSLTDALVETIVTDLSKEGQIRPPELQIVCTALTTNFTGRHYNELGGAKGILESYLNLTIETSADERMARLLLRKMCDFERGAKADPKTMRELVQAIGFQGDNLEATERVVQQVLAHLVQSRLAVMVVGKYGLIHDYWVSLIYDTTIHDRSEQENADELLRRHIHELQAGFSSTLNYNQLHLVRRFGTRQLLDTREAIRLLRKSALRLWVLRGITASIVGVVLISGLFTSGVVWQMTTLADPDGSTPKDFRYFHGHSLKDIGRFMFVPMDFPKQERSSISVWNIKNGERVNEFTADAWDVSDQNDVLLYADRGQSYLVDLKQNKRRTFPLAFRDGRGIRFSQFANCIFYRSASVLEDLDNIKGEFKRIQLWSVPESKLIGSTGLVTTEIRPQFVSDDCDRVVFTSKEASPDQSGVGRVSKVTPWIWNSREGRPKLLANNRTTAYSAAGVDVNEELKLIAIVGKDQQGVSHFELWDLENGRLKLERTIELGGYSWANVGIAPDGGYVVISTTLFDTRPEDEKVKLLRVSDLQESHFTMGQRVVQCWEAQGNRGDNSIGYFLWSIPGRGGYIWDASSNEPLPLRGMDSSEVSQCQVSPDRSTFALLRKGGLAELWSFKGNKVADLLAGGPTSRVDWTLQGTAIALVRDTGEIALFGPNGSILAKLPAPGLRGMSVARPDVSFEPSCRSVLVWMSDGRVVEYTKKLKVFGLPYAVPFFWHRTDRICEK